MDSTTGIVEAAAEDFLEQALRSAHFICFCWHFAQRTWFALAGTSLNALYLLVYMCIYNSHMPWNESILEREISATRALRQGHELQKYKIAWAKINQIRLREPFEIQTIQPEKYSKYYNEFGYAGHMLPTLISHKVIHHTLTYKGIILSMITPIHITYYYSPTDSSVLQWQ